MKIVLISERTLKTNYTFSYTELTESEIHYIIDGLKSYRESSQDMRNYGNPERVQEHKEIEELLRKIRLEN